MSVRRLLLALLAALAFTLVLTVPADATTTAPTFLGFPDCTNDPEVTAPDTGAANDLDPGPEKPRTGDPFAAKPKTSVYEAYGYAGLHWSSLRPDCDLGPDALNDSGGVMSEEFANIGLGNLSWATALVNRFTTLVYDTPYLDTLQPVLDTSNDVFGIKVFLGAAAMVFAGIALMVFAKAASGNLAAAMLNGTWAVGVLVVTIVMLTWPTLIAPKATQAITGSLDYVQNAVNDTTGAPGRTLAESAAGNIHYGILYQTWCAGTVGSGQSAAAKEYCPRLFKAQTISRAELAKTKGDAGVLKDLQDQKIKDYKDAANDLKDEYPSAYAYVAGDQNSDRIQAVFVGWVAFLLTLPFTLMAAVLFGFALLVIVAGLFIFPLVALLALYYPWRGPLLAIVDKVIVAGRNAIVYGAVSAVMLASFAGFFGPDSTIAPLWACVLMAIFAAAVWMQTKGFRSFGGGPGPLANRFSRKAGKYDMSEAPYDGVQPDQPGGTTFTPRPAGYSMPAEARVHDTGVRQPPVVRDAAIRGAIMGTVSAVATGGTTAAISAAAAKTAATQATQAKVADSASTGTGVAAVVLPAAARALGGGATKAPGTAVALANQQTRARPTDAPPTTVHAPQTAAGPRVVEPTTTPAGEVVYPIYSPSENGATL